MRAPTWSELGTVGNSVPAKASMLVPLVGYIILIQSPILSAFQGMADVIAPQLAEKPRTDISISNMYFVYFGLFFVGIASVIFTLFAHSNIKRYRDSDEFCIQTRGMLTIHEFKQMYEFITNNKHAKNLIDQGIEKSYRSIGINGEISLKSDKEIDIKKAYYYALDIGNPFARVLTLLIYTLGFSLLAVPSLKTFSSISAKLLNI